jgi:hypothetical protein
MRTDDRLPPGESRPVRMEDEQARPEPKRLL